MKLIDNTPETAFISNLFYGAIFKSVDEEHYGIYMKIDPNESGCDEYGYNAVSLDDGSLCGIEEDEVLLVVDVTLTIE